MHKEQGSRAHVRASVSLAWDRIEQYGLNALTRVMQVAQPMPSPSKMNVSLRWVLTPQQTARLFVCDPGQVLAASIRRLLQPFSSLRTILLDGPDQTQTELSSVGVLLGGCGIASWLGSSA